MTIPIEVHFHGLDRSESVEARAREKVVKLLRHCPRMTFCRIAIEAPHRHAHKARVYHVKLEIGMPHHDPIVVCQEGPYNPAHEDIMIALKDAFETALRRLDQTVDRRQAPAKRERSRRRPASATPEDAA